MGLPTKTKNVITAMFGIIFMIIGLVMYVCLLIVEIPKELDGKLGIWFIPMIPLLLGLILLHVPEMLIKKTFELTDKFIKK